MNFTSQKNLKDILDAVESCATLTAVARLLYTTQPNVSKTIAAAERDYGVELVKRNQTPVSLTPAGSYLKQRLERQLSYAAETSRGIKQFAPQRRLPVTLGFFPTYAPLLLPRFYPALRAKHPQLELTCKSQTTSTALAELKNGQSQLFIGRAAADPAITTRPLFSEQLCFVLGRHASLFSPAQPVRTLTTTHLASLQAEPFIRWSTESSFISVSTHFMELNDLNFASQLTVATYEEAMWLAAAGLGTTLAMVHPARFFLEKRPAVNLLVVPPEMASLQIAVMTRTSAEAAVQDLADEITHLLLAAEGKQKRPAAGEDPVTDR